MSSTSDIEKNPEPRKPKKKENLKQRAYLNSVTSILDYGSKTITGFIITPFIVNGLGSILYGAWQILGQFTSYTGLVDIRATQVLKWAIAKDRDAKDGKELREYVTATFLLIMLIVPFLMIAGAVISWYSPIITQVDQEYYRVVRITCGLLVLALVTKKVFSIFESILRGMNLGYKRMGFRAVVYMVGGGLKVAAIWFGYGLIGLAVVQILVSFIIGVTIYVIVKRHVPWFGFGKTDIKQSLSFLKISGWFMAWTGVHLLLMSTDKVLLGYLVGPVMVTGYVITKYLINVVQGVVWNVVHGVIPGIGKLYGNGEYDKLHKSREHILLLTWLFGVSIGSIVIVLNEPFLNMWIGEEYFAGQVENVLIIIMIFQYILIQTDSAVIDTTLEISQKVYMGLVSSLISIFFILLLVPHYGIAGLCIGIIAGRIIMSVGYPVLIYKKTDRKITFKTLPVRQLVAMTVIWGVAILFSKYINEVTWYTVILYGAILLALITPICFILGFKPYQRSEISAYKNKIKFLSTQDE